MIIDCKSYNIQMKLNVLIKIFGYGCLLNILKMQHCLIDLYIYFCCGTVVAKALMMCRKSE